MQQRDSFQFGSDDVLPIALRFHWRRQLFRVSSQLCTDGAFSCVFYLGRIKPGQARFVSISTRMCIETRFDFGLMLHRDFCYFWTNEARLGESCFDFGLMLHRDFYYFWTNEARLGESCFDFETDAAPRLVFTSGRMLHRFL